MLVRTPRRLYLFFFTLQSIVSVHLFVIFRLPAVPALPVTPAAPVAPAAHVAPAAPIAPALSVVPALPVERPCMPCLSVSFCFAEVNEVTETKVIGKFPFVCHNR
jgi:hypothetical protein